MFLYLVDRTQTRLSRSCPHYSVLEDSSVVLVFVVEFELSAVRNCLQCVIVCNAYVLAVAL